MKIDRKDELLLLIAVSGEIPSDWVGRAVGSESYAAALLTRLKREGEVKLRSKDGVRGYLLRNKAKQYLLVHYGDDVRLYLSGANSTNHVKSEPEKRLRLHRMSMVWIYFHHAGIRIFQSEKRNCSLFSIKLRSAHLISKAVLRYLIMGQWNGNRQPIWKSRGLGPAEYWPQNDFT